MNSNQYCNNELVKERSLNEKNNIISDCFMPDADGLQYGNYVLDGGGRSDNRRLGGYMEL